MDDYDVVVIGAGLGGLSAATRLSAEGVKVLLLERHNVPGGYASSFIRGRFEFDVSLHELSGYGSRDNPGPLWRLFEEYGISERVEFLPIPEYYRSVFPDVDVTIPLGRGPFEETMVSAFPHEKEGLLEFSRTMFDFAEQALGANRVGMAKVAADPGSYPVLMAHMGKSLSQVLDPLVADVKARAVLGQAWGYYCLPPSQLSFLIYALGTVGYLKFGPSHVRGTSQALSQAFVDVIEGNGSDVMLGHGARQILVEGGKVHGVMTDSGEPVDCAAVVCNANPYVTCMELIGPEHVPGWYLKRLGAGSGGASTLNVYLGLDCPYTEVGLLNHETFVNTGYDLDGHYELMKKGIDVDPAEAAVTAYNAVDEDFSPPGTAAVVITLIARADPWLELPPERYAPAKGLVADRVIRLAEKVAPGLRDHIEVAEVATPVTNARYTGNLSGSIIGFNETFSGTGLFRLPARGPLEGLYFANAWVNIGGGYEPSIYSGYLTARDVIKDLQSGFDPASLEKTKSKVEEQAGDAPEAGPEVLSQMESQVTRLHPDRLSLEVREVIEETGSSKTLRMISLRGPLPRFRAGQYVNLFVEIDGVSTSRPFSISSLPGKDHYDLTVRWMPGGFVSHYLLDRVSPGDRFESTGPQGSFCLEPLVDTDRLVFLAGGSGVTPFMSIIREITSRDLPYDVQLVYGNRDPADVIFGRELERIAGERENVRVDLVMSEPTSAWEGMCGLLGADVISELVGPFEGKTFFVCGPEAMHLLCGEALSELGVPGRLVRSEVYGPPADVSVEPGWPGIPTDREFGVVEERTGVVAMARAGEPLMIALERAGVVVPAVCRAGECAACRTRLVSGKVFMPERVVRRRVDESAGYIHPCMSYALEDLLIRI